MEDDLDLDSGTVTDTEPADFNFNAAFDAVASEMMGRGQEAAPSPPAADPPAPTPEEPPAPQPSTAPKSWKPEIAAKFATLEPEVQAEIARREDDFHRGIEVYKEDAALGKPMRQALAPYLPILQQYGIDPVAQVQNLMQAHHTLALGTAQEKTAMIKQLISDYRIDPSSLGLSTPTEEYTDPQVQALQKQLDELKSTVISERDRVAQAKRAELRAEVEAFAADPKNEFFDAVADDIARFMHGTKLTLAQAYEKAIWAHPTTRETLMQRKAMEAATAKVKADAEHAAKAAAAKSANVAPAPKSASVTAPTGSMEDTMKETLAQIRARSH